MIIRFEPVNAAATRIVEVYAHEDCIFLRILDSHEIVQWNKHIRVAGHHGFQLLFAQVAVEALGDIEGNHLFRWTIAAICAAVFASMPSIYYHGIKSLGRVFDRGSSNRAACGERRDQRKYD